MKFKIPAALICALFLAACSPESEHTVKSPERQTASAIEGTIIVKFDEATTEQLEQAGTPSTLIATRSQSILPELGLKSVQRVFPDAGRWEQRHRKAGLHRWYRVSFDPQTPLTKAQSGFEQMQGVEYAGLSPRKRLHAGIPFNDLYAEDQWGLYNPGASYFTGYVNGADINVVPVWQQFTAGSSNVIVAVIDSGVDGTQEDLAGVVIPGTQNAGSHSFIYDQEGPTIVPNDHGTHVAAIIAAINNNSKGICGVAGGKDGRGGVRILACQILQESADEEEDDLQGDSAQAMVWAADNGAVIAQNSWGYDDNNAPLDPLDKDAIDYFIANAGLDEHGNQVGPMAGGVVFFAAGNENMNKAYPAMYDKVVAVAAYGGDGKRSSYSNYGTWVDLCAPGGEVDRFDAEDIRSYVLSACPDDYYGMCGTSQACPHASGVAALLVSYFGGNGFTNEMLLRSMIEGARANSASSSRAIGPYLDAFGAFQAAQGIVSEVPNNAPELVEYMPNVVAESREVIEIDLSKYFSDPDGDVLTYTVSVSEEGIVNVDQQGNILRLQASYEGEVFFNVRAYDPKGANSSDNFFRYRYFNLAKNGFAAYPNPISWGQKLKVHAGKSKELTLRLFNASGAEILNYMKTASVFEPMELDMDNLPSGKYALELSYDGKKESKIIIRN